MITFSIYQRTLSSIMASIILIFFSACNSEKSDQAGSNSDQPNILMIVVDDMSDWVGYLDGHPDVKTPNIDRLAASSFAFQNAHCPSPKCGPSRTAIMTGLRPSTTGIYDNNQWWRPNLPEVVTLPMHFKANGYKVMGAGKIFHHTEGNNPPDQWDDFQDLVYDDTWDRTRPNQKQAYPSLEFKEKPEEIPLNDLMPYTHEFDWGSLDKPRAAYGDMEALRYGIKRLKEDHEKPFFLAIGFFHPHMPWYAPEEYFEMYDPELVKMPDTLANDLEDVPEEGKRLAAAARNHWYRIREADKWQEAVQAYLANISFADFMVGKLLDALDSSKYAKNTSVVFWSDHGFHLGEKQHWYKSTLWQRATHVPFIIRLPGESRQTRISQPVNLIDIYPTLMELCGLPHKSELDGRSLLPILYDNEYKNEPTLVTYRKGNHAIKDGKWNYIQYHDGGRELYDLETDIHEWYNLATSAEYDSVMRQLSRFFPEKNAAEKPTKQAFEFDPNSYSWTKSK